MGKAHERFGDQVAANYQPGELIDDREVARFDEDRLGHKDVVDQLVELARTVPTPSNIALYGAWGSGKSGVGRMLAAAIANERSMRFARFDAFKYAQNPLRRNFVSVVATELGQKSPKYHSDLYSGRVDTDFKVPAKKVGSLLLTFAVIALICVTVVLAVVALFAIIQQQDVWAALIAVFSSAVPASLVPATLLTAVIALIGRTFVQEKRIEKAESDEEFENLFRQLVADCKAERLVIFVDEIDRCAPDEVIETLDAVRTFLGVDKCIFIVAADPQSIEQALTEGSTQATPADDVNPYYSAGSGYLDKVFQYQISIPPLMPQSVTSFAAELVQGRTGVWQSVDTGVIASILIPTHVRSPRRVKNLLNSFALAYRLAEARRSSGLLDIDLPGAADELARLVCLRVEFPIFARDLVSDPELATYVLALAETEPDASRQAVWKNFPHVTPQIRRIAEAYAQRRRQVDRLLLDVDAEEDASGPDHDVVSAHGQQLIDYLSRTRLITGPTRALIHLQDSGPLYGLPAPLAAQLERDAQNGSLSSVRTRYAELDQDGRLAALRLLIQQARTGIGYESQNVARAILAAIGEGEVPSSVADACVHVVGQLVEENSDIIGEATALGAWTLALASDRQEATRLGADVLATHAVETDDKLLGVVLRSSSFARSVDSDRFSEILHRRLLSDDVEKLTASLADLENDQFSEVVSAVGPELAAGTREAAAAREEWERATKAAAASAAAAVNGVRRGAPPPASADDDELIEPFDPASTVDALAELIRTRRAVDQGGAERLASVLLSADVKIGRDAVEGLLPVLAPVAEAELSRLILNQLQRRELAVWAQWLAVIDPSVPLAAASALELKRLVVSARGTALADEEQMPRLRLVAERIEPLFHAVDDKTLETLQDAASDLGQLVEDSADLDGWLRRREVAEVLAHAGVADARRVDHNEITTLVHVLKLDHEEEQVESPMATFVTARVESVLGNEVEGNDYLELVSALRDCTWLSEFDDARLRATVADLAPDVAASCGVRAPDARTLLSYKADLSSDAYNSMTLHWLSATDEEAGAVLSVFDTTLRAATPPPPEFAKAMKSWRGRAGEAQRADLVRPYLENPARYLADDRLLSIGFRELPDQEATAMLITRYQASSTNPARVEALRLWRLANISESSSRAQLIKQIMIPIFRQGVTAVEPALSHLPNLARPVPRSVKKELGDAVVAGCAGRPALEARATAALESLGYAVRRTGFFGHRKEVDTSA
ncbi:P-loop NTPase fold protein [Microbacterium sp. ZW CA_36]|uniref:P-loop NTPase fold protein n=1 Tax=Microbacterium sp. ZW CA_36 TaxID=3378078 RepID=UPI0038542F09